MILSVTKMILIYLNYRLWSMKLKDIYGEVLDTLVLDRNLDVFDMYRLFLFLWMFAFVFLNLRYSLWYTYTQFKEGVSDVTFYWRTPIKLPKIHVHNFCISIQTRIRCYRDSWLYLSISSVILSLSIQTSTIGNDNNTIISTSFWFGVGAAPYFETFQRFFYIFKCNKNEDSVKARDQRITMKSFYDLQAINKRQSER